MIFTLIEEHFLSNMPNALKRLLSSPVFIVLFAFAVRIALMDYEFRIALTPVKSNLPYGYELGHVAASIAGGHGFASPIRYFETGPTAWFTPVYPYLVAGIFMIWGVYSKNSRIVIETLNCACAALTIFPIYGIAKRVFSKSAAVGASWAWLLLPTSLLFPITWIWDTALTALLLSLIFWATLVIREHPTAQAWAAYGALWALGILTNPSLLSLLPFLAGWALWQVYKDGAPWPKLAATGMLVIALSLVPWTVRNYRVFGKLIVLRSNFGLELWLGNNPNVPDTWSPWMHPNDNPAEADKYKRIGEIAFMAEKQNEALAFIRTHPADTALFMFRRFVNNWLGITDSPVDMWSSSPYYLKAFIVQNCMFSLFALLGVLFAYRNRCPEALPFAMVLLVFPSVFYLTHTSLRYRFPMDPIMIVLAAYGFAYPLALLRKRPT